MTARHFRDNLDGFDMTTTNHPAAEDRRAEPLIDRRTVLQGIGAAAAGVVASTDSTAATPVVTGAAALAAAGFSALKGKRIGLVTNHTGRVGTEHLADLLRRRGDLKLAAILAPEHGFRGAVEAGAKVRDGRDPATGVPVLSLYGANRKPTPQMLRDLDCLVFDIQDVGVRFYTYISTMGLAMQAAAQARLPFFVLDRPNPIGGEDVAGFALEPAFTSFVGQYPMPIVHGLTVGELARMIKGERWLTGLGELDLQVLPLAGWKRASRWSTTALPWVATSPNIPSFVSALVYPGIGIVGETLVNEGRGTPIPFQQFGAPWLDAAAASRHLTAQRLPGARFEAVAYVPKSIPDVALHPRFENERVNAVRITIADETTYRPLEVGTHALAHLRDVARARGAALFDKRDMFRKIAGTRRLEELLDRGAGGADIIAAWHGEVARFEQRRANYLLYS